MISDFLEVNGIDAKVLSFPSEVSIEKVLAVAGLTKNGLAKVVPFFNEKMDLFVIVALEGEVVSKTTAQEIFGEKELFLGERKDVYKLGFEKDYFPPVSVYGARTELTALAKTKSKLLFVLSENEFLVISPKEIEKANSLDI